jgi:peptide deformylase
MIKDIKQHPTAGSFDFGGTVRHFDESLFTLLQDLKDTIEANDLKGLSAFQISSPLTVMVIKKEDGSFLEIINPIIINKSGKINPLETTAYFPNLSATTTRHKTVKLMYEDREGKQHFLEADGELSILIQRKTDYLLGSNFLIRLSKEEKEKFENKIAYNTNDVSLEVCPTSLKSDKVLKAIKYGLIAGFIGISFSFFLSTEMLSLLKMAENYLMLFLAFLTLLYFVYAQYEGKKYSSCTSCQIGNIMALTLIKTIHISLLFLTNYFLVY